MYVPNEYEVQCTTMYMPNVYTDYHDPEMYIPNVHSCCPMYIMCPNVYTLYYLSVLAYTLGNMNIHWVTFTIMSPNVYNVTQCI